MLMTLRMVRGSVTAATDGAASIATGAAAHMPALVGALACAFFAPLEGCRRAVPAADQCCEPVFLVGGAFGMLAG